MEDYDLLARTKVALLQRLITGFKLRILARAIVEGMRPIRSTIQPKALQEVPSISETSIQALPSTTSLSSPN